MKKLLILSSFSFSLLTLKAQPYTIHTFAGNGHVGYSGVNVQATSAELNYPTGIAVDSKGNVYIADYNNFIVRKVDTNGVINPYAGRRIFGFSGDHGRATDAEMSRPYSVAVDANDNLFISDFDNNCIRMVTHGDSIYTVVGNRTPGYSGDGGNALAAELKNPNGIIFDNSGNLYITDGLSNCVRKVNTSGIISTVAGNGIGGFTGDGSQATSAELFDPYSTGVDASGNLFIADYGNNCVRMVNTIGIISTVVGNGIAGYSGDGSAASSAELNEPMGITFDATDNLYITDHSNNCIRLVDHRGIISTFAGNGIRGFSGDGGSATAAELANPSGSILFNKYGEIFIADGSNARIRKLNITGTGVNDLQHENGEVIIYPNPNNGVFQLSVVRSQWSGLDGQESIEIFDITGKKIFTQINIQNPKSKINISSQPSGIYFYSLLSTGNSVVSTGKFIIQK